MSDVAEFHLDPKFTKLVGVVNARRAELITAAQLVSALAGAIPLKAYAKNCTHPDAVAFAQASYQSALALYVLAEQDLKNAMTAARE